MTIFQAIWPSTAMHNYHYIVICQVMQPNNDQISSKLSQGLCCLTIQADKIGVSAAFRPVSALDPTTAKQHPRSTQTSRSILKSSHSISACPSSVCQHGLCPLSSSKPNTSDSVPSRQQARRNGCAFYPTSLMLWN